VLAVEKRITSPLLVSDMRAAPIHLPGGLELELAAGQLAAARGHI
jgi:hypothetical protein